MKYITSAPKGINGTWLCDDDGEAGNFSNPILQAKIDDKDWEFFENDYVRCLARIESLGIAFSKTPDQSYKDDIDFDLLAKLCLCVQEMPYEKKQKMLENLKVHRVF